MAQEVDALPPAKSLVKSKSLWAQIISGVFALLGINGQFNTAGDVLGAAGTLKDNAGSVAGLLGIEGTHALVTGATILVIACVAFAAWDRLWKSAVDQV